METFYGKPDTNLEMKYIYRESLKLPAVLKNMYDYPFI